MGLYFAAKLLDEDTQIFDLIAVIGPPDGLQQFAMRDGLVGMGDEVAEQFELFWCEADCFPFYCEAARSEIDLNVPEGGFLGT